MATRRLTAFFSGLARLKPGEARLAFLLFGYFFCITAPFAVVKSIRDASYLDDLGPKNLPYAYGTAILIGAVVALHARLQARLHRRTLLSGTIVFFLATALLFERLFEGAAPEAFVLLLVYWFWANMFVAVLTTQFWILVNDIFNPREAKRLIGFFGSGGILGGIVGGLLTGFLGKTGNSQHLLFLVAGFLATGFLVVRSLFAWLRDHEGSATNRPAEKRGPTPSSRTVGFGDCFRSVRRSDYLRILGAAVLVAGIVSTLIDWQSKAVFWNTIGGEGGPGLTSFFGFFNAGLQGLAFLFQLVLTSRTIERFGIGPSFMIYPLLLLFGFGGITIWPILLAGVLLKGGDKALSYSIQQSARELLYIPVPPEAKYRAKIFIDMFLNRVSKLAGGAVLLAILLLRLGTFGGSNQDLTPTVHSDIEKVIPLVSAAAAVFIFAWLFLGLRISRAYVREVKDNLAQKWERGDIKVARTLDPEAAKLVVDALESRRESPELFALHLYDLARENKLTAEVADLLGVSDFGAGRSPGLPFLDAEEAPWVPAFEGPLPAADLEKEIREILALSDYQSLMSGYADRVLEGTGESTETAKMEMAKAIGLMDPSSPLVERLEALLLDPSPRVFHYASESAGRLLVRAHVPLVLRGLADPRTADDARTALARFGPGIAGTLADVLLDSAEPAAVRSEAARLLGRTGSPDAAKPLLEALSRDGGELSREALDALDELRAEPSFPALPEDAVLDRFEETLERVSKADSPAGLLPVFKLLGLAYSHEDIFRAFQNLIEATKDSVAYALELLDHMVPAGIKEKLIRRIESLPGCGGGR